jgi:hypothetical protein
MRGEQADPEHDGRFHQFGGPGTHAGKKPQQADGTKEEAHTEDQW